MFKPSNLRQPSGGLPSHLHPHRPPVQAGRTSTGGTRWRGSVVARSESSSDASRSTWQAPVLLELSFPTPPVNHLFLNHGQCQRQHAPAPGVRYGVCQLDGLGCVRCVGCDGSVCSLRFDCDLDLGPERPALFDNITASAGTGECRLGADVVAGRVTPGNTQVEQQRLARPGGGCVCAGPRGNSARDAGAEPRARPTRDAAAAQCEQRERRRRRARQLLATGACAAWRGPFPRVPHKHAQRRRNRRLNGSPGGERLHPRPRVAAELAHCDESSTRWLALAATGTAAPPCRCARQRRPPPEIQHARTWRRSPPKCPPSPHV